MAAITEEQIQEIASRVLASIRTNSRTIDQLTAVLALSDTDLIEIHGGKKAAFAVIKKAIVDELLDKDKNLDLKRLLIMTPQEAKDIVNKHL